MTAAHPTPPKLDRLLAVAALPPSTWAALNSTASARRMVVACPRLTDPLRLPTAPRRFDLQAMARTACHLPTIPTHRVQCRPTCSSEVRLRPTDSGVRQVLVALLDPGAPMAPTAPATMAGPTSILPTRARLVQALAKALQVPTQHILRRCRQAERDRLLPTCSEVLVRRVPMALRREAHLDPTTTLGPRFRTHRALRSDSRSSAARWPCSVQRPKQGHPDKVLRGPATILRRRREPRLSRSASRFSDAAWPC